jgi:hypothetical protein
MIEIIYILIIIILGYFFFYLEKRLKKEYYTNYALSSGLAIGRFAFIPLLFPKRYFKKESFCRAYILYIIRTAVPVLIVYLLFFKLIIQ